MDHMDLPSLRQIRPRHLTITARLTSDVLSGARLKQITELGWNAQTTFEIRRGKLQIEAIEVKHWGQRWPSDFDRGYNGYIFRREGKTLLRWRYGQHPALC